MDYLTNHYKFKAEQLQERYEFLQYKLKVIIEEVGYDELIAGKESIHDITGVPENATPEQIKSLRKKYVLNNHIDQLSHLTPAEQEIRLTEFKRGMSAFDILSDPEKLSKYQRDRKAGVSPEQVARERSAEAAKERAAKASTQTSATSAPKTETPKTETPPQSEAPKYSDTRAEDPYREHNAEARRKADQRAQTSAAEAEARAAKGETAKPASEVKAKKPAGPSKFNTFVKGQFPTLTKPSTVPGALKREIVGGVKHMFTPAGLAGLGAGYVADKAMDVAADVTGVETLKNPWVKTPTSWAAMNAVDTAVGQGARALGTRAGLAAVGGSALSGALLGAAAYGGYKAGEALSDVELPFQGEGKRATVSDALGKGIYYAARSPFNWIAGNATGAGTSDLNEKPKGVAGGDPAMLARNAAADEEEKQKAKERAEWIANRAKQLQGQSEND
jgi:curved DNA-binding protein CbpA